MAFSTQKDFLNYQLLDEHIDLRNAKEGAIKLKSYGSSIDTRALDINKKRTANYISDIVSCRVVDRSSPKNINNYDQNNQCAIKIHTPCHPDPENHSLAGSINFDNPSDDRISNQLYLTKQETINFKHKLQVAELGLRNLTDENKTLRLLLDANPINDKCQLLIDAINELFKLNSITKSDKDKLELLVQGISVSLREEKNNQSEGNKDLSIDGNLVSKTKVEESYQKVLHERNKLRYQLCRMADFEDKIQILKEKAIRSDCLDHQLKLANQKLLAIQLAANKQVEANCENERLKEQLRDAKIILHENFNLKRQFTKIMFELTKFKNSEKELEIAKNDLCRYESIIRDYECQLQEMMEVVEDLQNEKIGVETKRSENVMCKQNFKNRNGIGYADYHMKELTESSKATMEQMQLELKARKLLQMELEATREELDDLREKCQKNNDTFENLTLQNNSLKTTFDKIIEEVYEILQCRCDLNEMNNTEDPIRTCEVKAQILRDEVLNLKQQYNKEIEEYKKQIDQLNKINSVAEEEANNEKNVLVESISRSSEILRRQEVITKIQQKTLEETEKALDEQKKLVINFKDDLDHQKESIKSSQSNLEVLISENNNLVTENRRMIQEIKEKNSLIDRLNTEIRQLTKEVELGENDLKKISAETAAQTNELLEKIYKLETELREIKKKYLSKCENNKKKDHSDKRLVEVYTLKESESKRDKEIKDLFEDIDNKLNTCAERDNILKLNINRNSLENEAKKIKLQLELEDEGKRASAKNTNSSSKISIPTQKSSRDKNDNENICDPRCCGGKDKIEKSNEIKNIQIEKQIKNDKFKEIKLIEPQTKIGDTIENLKFAPLAGLTMFSCYTPVTMTKLQIVCKKIFDNGIDCLTIKELTYLHCFIYKAGMKHKPESMHSLPGEQKCCKCSNFSCCLPNILRDAEKRLNSRLKTIEKDVEILDKSLNFLKQKDDITRQNITDGQIKYDNSASNKPVTNQTLAPFKRKCKSLRSKSPKSRYLDAPTRDIA